MRGDSWSDQRKFFTSALTKTGFKPSYTKRGADIVMPKMIRYLKEKLGQEVTSRELDLHVTEFYLYTFMDPSTYRTFYPSIEASGISLHEMQKAFLVLQRNKTS